MICRNNNINRIALLCIFKSINLSQQGFQLKLCRYSVYIKFIYKMMRVNRHETRDGMTTFSLCMIVKERRKCFQGVSTVFAISCGDNYRRYWFN